ncbi:MAG: 30S ribosomal protein S9 [Planctomycetota bacterium]|jgi:small subunit ribosomal protein S9
MPDGHWFWGTGRRKTAVARVRIRPGAGKFMVNRREYDKYFTEDRDRRDLVNVLQKTRTEGSVDVHVNVRGGGYTGQAGAIVLGLGRALKRYDDSLEAILRENGFLTRDPRKVERKKYGQPGARKRFQFSKR